MNIKDFVLKQEWYTMNGEYIETTYEKDIPLWVKKEAHPLIVKNVKSCRDEKIVYESMMINTNILTVEEVKRKIGHKTFYFIYGNKVVGFNIDDLTSINERLGEYKGEIVDIIDMTPSYSMKLELRGNPDLSIYTLHNVFGLDKPEDGSGALSNFLRYEYDMFYRTGYEFLTADEFADRLNNKELKTSCMRW